LQGQGQGEPGENLANPRTNPVDKEQKPLHDAASANKQNYQFQNSAGYFCRHKKTPSGLNEWCLQNAL
jgi:hypothetical protein